MEFLKVYVNGSKVGEAKTASSAIAMANSWPGEAFEVRVKDQVVFSNFDVPHDSVSMVAIDPRETKKLFDAMMEVLK